MEKESTFSATQLYLFASICEKTECVAKPEECEVGLATRCWGKTRRTVSTPALWELQGTFPLLNTSQDFQSKVKREHLQTPTQCK